MNDTKTGVEQGDVNVVSLASAAQFLLRFYQHISRISIREDGKHQSAFQCEDLGFL